MQVLVCFPEKGFCWRPGKKLRSNNDSCVVRVGKRKRTVTKKTEVTHLPKKVVKGINLYRGDNVFIEDDSERKNFWQASVVDITADNRILIKWKYQYSGCSRTEWVDKAQVYINNDYDADWCQPLPGVQTRLINTNYDDDGKETDATKILYREFCVKLADDLNQYYATLPNSQYENIYPHGFSLEGKYLSLTKLLVQRGITLPQYMDVVSRSVDFRIDSASSAVPTCYTGDAMMYLKTIEESCRYDMMFIDACGTWEGKNRENGSKQLMKLIFEKRLLDDVAILNITASYRDGARSTNEQYQHVWSIDADLAAMANAYGYRVKHMYSIRKSSQVIYMFWKVLHKNSMLEIGGVPYNNKKETALDWLEKSVQ